MDRKIKLSIRIKIIAVISALIVVSLGLYLFVALRLFHDDKQAYVFQATSDTASAIRTQAESFVVRLLKDSINIYNLLVDRDFKPEDEQEPLSLHEILPQKALNLGLPKSTSDLPDLRLRYEKASTKRQVREVPHLALLYLKSGSVAEAEKLMLSVKNDPGKPLSADQLFAAAMIDERRWRYLDAQKKYVEFIANYRRDKRWAMVQMKLGDYAVRDRQFDKAETHYKFAKSIDDPDLSAYVAYRLAWMQHYLGRPRDAIVQFKSLLKRESFARVRRSVLADDAEAIAVEQFTQTKSVIQEFLNLSLPRNEAKTRFEAILERARRLRDTPKGKSQATTVLESKLLLRSLFHGDRDLVEFSVYTKVQKRGTRPRRLLRLVNQDYLSEHNLKANYLDRVDHERVIDWSRVTPQKPILQNSSLKDGMGLLSLVRQDPLTGRYLVLRFKLDHFLSMFQNPIYTSFLTDNSGNLYAHRDAEKLTQNINMLDETYVASVVKSRQAEGAREQVNNDGMRLIVAHASLSILDLVAFAEIRSEKAFLAAKVLTERSIFFGLFFIVIAMIIGIIFAKSLTNPIERLFRGTKVIAAGKFEERVLVDTGDEIGVLAESFNYMAGRILTLLGQEKDKVRMEEELKVAKLVQDSFFPANRLRIGCVEIAAYYTPAAECGGDWWWCVPVGERVMLLVGDATGHGVPAALITATAASCCTTIRELGATKPEILNSPAEILRLLNKAVYGAAQGKILMTFFIAIVDPVKMLITYSNASHNPPYLYKFKERDPDKKDLKPLQDAVSLRLGHEPDAAYTDAVAEIAPNDVMVLFTDGFIECTNRNKEEYGNRRFIKSILKSAKIATEDICNTIVNSAMEHYAGHPLGDDLTLVCMKLHAQEGAFAQKDQNAIATQGNSPVNAA